MRSPRAGRAVQPLPAEVAGAAGKRVRGALYIHRDALPLLEEQDRQRVERAAAFAPDVAWNVARLEEDVVGLLHYPRFEDDAFPELQASASVDLQSGAVRRLDFSRSENPLILHRKELLVGPDHPKRQDWERVTALAKQRGLFDHPAAIGRRRAWQALLRSAGLDDQGQEAA